MKKIIVSALVGFSLLACDKIPMGERVKNTGVSCGECTTDPTEEFITEKAVLLEEFTGITCNNCPAAAVNAHALLDKYGDRMHMVSIHCSNFAVPQPPEYPADFRTTEGTEIYDFAGNPGLPSGLIDRVDYETPTYSFKWEEKIDNILSTQTIAEVGVKAELNTDETQRTVCLTAKFKAVSDVSNRNLYWSAFLTENGIVATQKMGDAKPNEDYEHEHLFRTTFNSTFGSPLPETFTGTVDDVICDSRQIVLDDEWVWENCSVIVFVYDADTFEILQTIETHL